MTTLTPAVHRSSIDCMLERIDRTAAEDEPGFPHHADPATGAWTRSPNGDWTGGFWNGLLWLAATATGEERYRRQGLEWARRLAPRAESETVFRGFLFWYGAALGSELHGDEEARELALRGARGFASDYNPAARVIPLGEQGEEASDVGRGEANIDGVPGGTPLLAWAAREAGDDRLAEIAAEHARRHIELCVRADGSVVQSASFDPATGEVERRYTHKGARDDSTWTRAQAWGMLGYAQAAAWLGGGDFLEPLARTCDWWIAHLPEDRVARWDFDAPEGPDAERDTSGTAIAAAALLKAAALAPERAARYRECATEMLGALATRHLTPVGPDDRRPPGILADGCYNHRLGLATADELIWGDYFLFEALLVADSELDPLAV
jgi:unsaturated chondroitin disaccharide hydrolase